MGSPVLTISLVPSNLRQEEAYVQILDSLQQLDRVSRDVFDRIDAKSREQQTRLKVNHSKTSNSTSILQSELPLTPLTGQLSSLVIASFLLRSFNHSIDCLIDH
jgi:WAHD domain of WASH complex